MEERIRRDLAPFDAVDAAIAKVKEQYAGLKINGPADKDGYKMVHGAWQHVRGIRLDAEKLHKALGEDAIKYKRALDARLRQVKEGLKPIEDDLYEQWKAEDTRKEREAEEARVRAAEEAKRRIEQRRSMLFSLGLTWNGAAYSHPLHGVPEIAETQVTGLDDGPFTALVAEIGEAVSVAKARKAEAERKAKEEADRIAAAQAELDRKAKELAEQEAAMQARMAAMQAKVEEARTNEVAATGANGMEAPVKPYAQYGEADWTARIEVLKITVAARKEKEAEAAAKAEEDRKAHEERIRAEAVEAERKRAEAAKEAEAKAEAERVARMSDAEKWTVWVDVIKASAPSMDSEVGKAAVARVLAGLDKMTNDFNTNAQ